MATRPNPRERGERAARILPDVLARAEPALRRQAARHARRAVDADDALQEACTRFLRCYGGEPGPPALRWLMTTVKRCAWEIARSPAYRYAAPFELAATDAFDPEGTAVGVRCRRPGPFESIELGCELAALDALKPDQRTALLLLGHGYSYREIASHQGWTYTKVNRCIAEGRVALREATERAETRASSVGPARSRSSVHHR